MYFLLTLILALASLFAPPARAEVEVHEHALVCDPEHPCDPALHRRVNFWIDMDHRWSTGDAITIDERYPWQVTSVAKNTECRSADVYRLRRRLKNPHLICLTGKRELFAGAIQRSGLYARMIYRTFDQFGLPRDLALIPYYESLYRTDIRSRSKAVGIWQFMPGTAYDYDLLITRYVDQRRDPDLSTYAVARYFRDAARYLQQVACSRYGSDHDLNLNPLWVTSLNCGQGGAGKILAGVGADFVDFLTKWDSFFPTRAKKRKNLMKFDVKNYWPQFLAVKHIIDNRDKYFPDVEPLPALEYRTVRLDRRTPAKLLAETYGISLAELKELNPSLIYPLYWEAGKKARTLPNDYPIHVRDGYKSVGVIMESPDRG